MPAETARSAVAASWPGLGWLWLAHSQPRPGRLAATAVLAVAAGIQSGQTRWTDRQRQ